MPVPVKYRMNNPFFNEFVYHTITHAPQEFINKLPAQLYKHTKSNQAIKTFADSASLEKKLEMITRLGAHFSLTVSPPDYLNKAKLDDILENYHKKNRLDDIDEMLRQKVFTFTERELMHTHTIMAMNCHNPTYMLNRDYELIGKQIAAGKINTRIRDVELLKEVMEDQKLMCKLVLYTLRDQNVVVSGTGFKARELMILLYLFLNRNRYVDQKEVIEFFQSIYSPQVVNTSMYNMLQSFHLDLLPKTNKYAIAGLGIQAMGDYVNRLLNLTLSF